jgi:hypothetical protein
MSALLLQLERPWGCNHGDANLTEGHEGYAKYDLVAMMTVSDHPFVHGEVYS